MTYLKFELGSSDESEERRDNIQLGLLVQYYHGNSNGYLLFTVEENYKASSQPLSDPVHIQSLLVGGRRMRKQGNHTRRLIIVHS